ncbi:levanase [Vibrio albus]|uniref:Levanase n=1 Tax=Vibrio albus TaxID=2200953 RepID=A0A2U3B6Y4_9VIBR|nr:glycoside hydrolase family 32 protein [Vibrio albus]PWI32559.1 levanase [Vibrio albus]
MLPNITSPFPIRPVVTLCALITLFISGVSSGSDTESDKAAESSTFSLSTGREPYRPTLHLTPARHWINDPQRPVLINGVWHYYYLYNADYPDGNGTEWYHVTSTDLVHWQEHGVAIDKYKNGLGDIETGSAVIDTKNTAGFGAGVVIAIMTQQHEGIQRQSLFFSTDNGYRFKPYKANPVMDNPGSPDWRDPKIIWDDIHNEWLMVLAEGHKIGFYTSTDLKHWTYQSGFQRDDLGLFECPDLFRMSVDGDPNRTRWVLATGANGVGNGMTTGTVYWTGDWDGKHFTTDDDNPKWLDMGADFYAMVTWKDPRLSKTQQLTSRYAIGWLNNWAYATKLPTRNWHGGGHSVVRRIKLKSVDGRPVLISHPINALDRLEGKAEILSNIRVTNTVKTVLPQPTSDAYRLRIKLSQDSDAKEVQFRLKEQGGHYATIGYNFQNKTVYIRRDTDAIANLMPEVYREVRKALALTRDSVITLDIIVDTTSVEVFVNHGEVVLSNLVFGVPGAKHLSVESLGGDTELRFFQLSPLNLAPIKRYAGNASFP